MRVIFEGKSVKVFLINAGNFRLDGGAMFGVVPKTIWSKLTDVNDKNQIPLATNVLLIDFVEDGRKVIVDTGNGRKMGEKFRKIYEIEDLDVEVALERSGFKPFEITDVILTHLHFDHSGGATKLKGGKLIPAFPDAKYYVQKREWEEATHPNERNRASYLPENFIPLKENGCLELVDGDVEIFKGVRVIPTPGHTLGHQSVLLEVDGRKIFYCGDLIPTSNHVPIPYIMAYDLYPVKIIETKRAILERGVKEDWIFIFEHDPVTPAGKVFIDEKGKFKFKEISDIKDIPTV